MKITVELPENDVREICRLTGLKKKGPAIRKLVADALILRRRAEITAKFISGEWGVDLAGYEDSKAKSRGKSQTFASLWRD